MPGILIQTDNVEHFNKLIQQLKPDFTDKDLSIQIDSDGFDDYPVQCSAAPHCELESLETSEDCARPYPINSASPHNDPCHNHNISNQSLSGLQQSVEFVGGTPTFDPPNVANEVWARGWARGWAAQAWCDWQTSNIVMEPKLAEAMGRVILKLIEDPQALERSELYRQRIAGISTAALGYAPKSLDQIAGDYITPALKDTMNLYEEYNKAYQALQAAGYYKNAHGNWTPKGVEERAIDELAAAYQGEAEQSADRTIADLQAQCAQLREQVKLGHANLRAEAAEATRYAQDCGKLRKELEQFQQMNQIYGAGVQAIQPGQSLLNDPRAQMGDRDAQGNVASPW